MDADPVWCREARACAQVNTSLNQPSAYEGVLADFRVCAPGTSTMPHFAGPNTLATVVNMTLSAHLLQHRLPPAHWQYPLQPRQAQALPVAPLRLGRDLPLYLRDLRKDRVGKGK
jgi:hypothetical protein